MVPRILAALAVAALSACGGGGSGAGAPLQAEPNASTATVATATPLPSPLPAPASGLAASPPAGVNTITAGMQTVRAIDALASGGYAISWSSQDASGTSLYVQRFDAQGARTGSETNVASDGAIAVLRDGTTVVVSVQGGAVVAQRFDSIGMSAGAGVILAAGSFANPVVVALADGGFAAGWSASGADGLAQHARRFDASGRALGAPVDFAAAGPDRNLALRLAPAPNGDFVAGVTHRFNGIGYWQFRIGTATVGLLDDADAGLPELNTTLLPLADGRFALWSTGDGGGYMQVLDATGRVVGATAQVAVVPETAVTLSDGGWATVTRQMPGLPFLAQRFDAAGRAVGDRVELAAGIARPIGVSSVGAGFAIAWSAASGQGDTDVKAQRVAAP